MNYQSVLRRLKLDKVKNTIVSEVTCVDTSNVTIALSLSLGVFLAFSPAWGFQTVLAISLALLLKLNKVLALITVNISSIPPLIPLIIIAGYQTGALVLHGEFQNEVPDLMNLRNLGENYLQFALGSFVFALMIGVIFYLVIYLILGKYRKL
ncbi:hypothetical protein BZG02_04325 [Labilibaculum filiforme]|uniref:DUF2062 domain-containing protein n=1 Tax=Labilibaculum filiforme TaxID=1940526 RepID=A0A2N3I432_9BACT|nr:DUF2062 domain-containing protein [Labilibaculum filiforme]PKQ65064.1 hypothetical protein BZG02_04325 [Labilibaculum filiforme]